MKTAKLKRLAHKEVDVLWKRHKAWRGEMYKAIAKALDVKPKKAHIKNMSGVQCQRIIDLSKDGAIETMIVIHRAKKARRGKR